MPLFFFISGYLFKSQNKKEYFLKKTRTLLLPYFSFLIILYPIEYPFLEGSSLIKYILKPIYGGRLLNNGLIAFWFITCLFLTQQLFNLLIQKIKSEKIFALIIFSFLIISYINSEFYPSFTLPWNANVVFAAIPFFYAGYLLKKQYYSINIKVILIFIAISLCFVYYKNQIIYDMKTAYYGIPFISFVLSLTSILFIIIFSKKIEKLKVFSIPLNYIGEKSMVIMFLHQPIYIYLINNFNFSTFITYLIIIGISCMFYLIFDSNLITKFLFLGSKKKIKNKIITK